MSDPSSQPTQPLTDAVREEIRDWHNKTRDSRVGALLAELDRLHSWNGLMELLDEHWPEDIFPTLDDDNRRDPGPRIVSLLRWVNTYRAVADGAHAEADRIRAENTAQSEQLAAGDASDGYHTHNELYDYRMLYNAHAAHGWLSAGHLVVKSWKHSDGELCFGGGWFVVAAVLPTGQVTNHYEAKHWGLFNVPEELPPVYDGHTPADAADRLRSALGLDQDGRGQ